MLTDGLTDGGSLLNPESLSHSSCTLYSVMCYAMHTTEIKVYVWLCLLYLLFFFERPYLGCLLTVVERQTLSSTILPLDQSITFFCSPTPIIQLLTPSAQVKLLLYSIHSFTQRWWCVIITWGKEKGGIQWHDKIKGKTLIFGGHAKVLAGSWFHSSNLPWCYGSVCLLAFFY